MKAHLQYLKYVIRHKWFVFQACLKWGVPLWRAIIHDWSKLSPAEWTPYVQKFFWSDEQRVEEIFREVGSVGNIYEAIPYGRLVEDRFTAAWNHHYHANPHHWDYWITYKDGQHFPLPMPETYVREMIADWTGAGQAKDGNGNPVDWYEKNGAKFLMHDDTRRLLERLLNEPK